MSKSPKLTTAKVNTARKHLSSSIKTQAKLIPALLQSLNLNPNPFYFLIIKFAFCAMTSHHKGEESDQFVIQDKTQGTLAIKPRAFNITWGDDSRYWKLNNDGTAELVQVSWLQVYGRAKLSYFEPGKEYAVKFRVELKPDNFGWANQPIYVMAAVDSHRTWKKSDLSTKLPGVRFDVPIDKLLTFRIPEDGSANASVEIGMYEIWKRRWKGGLLIHEVFIEPCRP